MEKHLPTTRRGVVTGWAVTAFALIVLGSCGSAVAAERLVLCEEFTNPT